MNQSIALHDPVVLAPMTVEEARSCRDRIKGGIRSVREDLLALYEREGWKALGHTSWRDCAQKEFGYSQSHGYRLLDAAKVERNIAPVIEEQRRATKSEISPEGETPIPEKRLRPLAKLKPKEQREAWKEVVSQPGPITAKKVKRTVSVRQRIRACGTPMSRSAVQVLINIHKLQGEKMFQGVLDLVATGKYDSPQKAYTAYKADRDPPPTAQAKVTKPPSSHNTPCPTCGCTCRMLPT